MTTTTTALCTTCKQGIPAQIVEREGRIYLDKHCPTHGSRQVLLASDASWYHRVMDQPARRSPPADRRPPAQGCPFDCGPCEAHEQRTYLPVVPVTSACNLDCPICYTINKNEGAYHMPLDEFAAILEAIRRNDPELKIINFTGGEPTLHPRFRDIIRMCHEAGIHRITVSTHGLTFLNDEALLEELAAQRARIVLSFNSWDEAVNKDMLGARILPAKLKVLELLEKYDVDTTLIPVLARGYNDGELGKLVDFLLEKDFMRSLEIHTMTFTGQGGLGFDPDARLTPPDVMGAIEAASRGRISMADFSPSPCAHPLCYQTCYLLQAGDEHIPFARFMRPEQVRELLTGNLYMEPGPRMEETLQEVIHDLWAAEIPEATAAKVLGALKGLIQRLFPSEPLAYAQQQRISERAAKTIYIHSHMDDESFETDRIRECCVTVPSRDGSTIPTCAYNILYRGRDPRFADPEGLLALDRFTGGRRWDHEAV